MTDAAPEIAKLTYEQALAELETLIRRLESGSVDLAESIASYERGVALAARCAELLEATERKVDRLVLGARGEVTEQPLDLSTAEDG
ncbi:MAG TPA: exodeoxyribonuclease VII small subunit [Candidatus Dormibacteraeota bacterium]|nr:exodeoxyribonuclease VII small subunit [Candidatus Dormibacteraeota bacterium]